MAVAALARVAPPAALVTFLADGPPPVYVGFGSMIGENPRALAETVVTGIQRTGLRAVIATGWGGLTATSHSSNILVTESVPHDWLFPRVSAVVHHGGSGTLHAGIRAGVPTLVVPFFGDQFIWGRRVQELGVGPRPIPQRDLTAKKLADALRSMHVDGSQRQRAATLGEGLRREHGVRTAVQAFERAYSEGESRAGV